MRKLTLFAVCTAMLLGGQAFAQTDGSRTSAGDAYGGPLSVQLTQTGFGDAVLRSLGSELDAAYVDSDGTNLYLMFTGNLQNNFNKLNIFIDSIPGAGENVITRDTTLGGNNPTNDGWANRYQGLNFDTGFSPDYLIIARNGNFNGDRFDLDFNTVGNDSFFESVFDVFGGTQQGSDGVLPISGVTVGFNNSNVAGVMGGDMAADQTAAAAVETGVEFKIPLSEIGASPGDTIRIAAHVNSSNHDYLSNQTLGALQPQQGNLGADGAGGGGANLSLINFNDFPGDQFFEVTIPMVGSSKEIDGSRTASGDDYGTAVAVQETQTGFGDVGAAGSELDAAYAYYDGTNLHLMFTGNLENNLNKMNIFIDSMAGGENVITASTGNGGNNPTNDGWADKHVGLTFDAGFSPDYMLIARNGSGDFFLDFNSVGNATVVETGIDVFGGSREGSDGMLANGILVGFDDSNRAGVMGGTMAADQVAAAAVETGMEFSIPVSVIGAMTGDTIRIAVHVNNGNHDYLSNQFLGGLQPDQGNLGGDGAGGFTGTLGGIDFTSFAGDQFFEVTLVEGDPTVTPETFTVTRGDYVSGGIPELEFSDNMDLSVRRRGTDTQSRTEFEVKSTSPTATPTTFEFTLEGAVFARSNVIQTIELFDYVAAAWELVDTRDAARSPSPDLVVTVAATGDLSRFVEAGTMSIEARVRYRSESTPRQNFASNTDQTVWTIE